MKNANNFLDMRIIILLPLIFIICACGEVNEKSSAEIAPAMETTATKAAKGDSYSYPYVDWSTFKTHSEKVAACEIPNSVLKDISTEGLVETCMNYPFLFDAYAFDSPVKGLRTVASRSNGFKELLRRNDNCEYVFKYLLDNDVRNVNYSSLTGAEEGGLLLRYYLCEYLLSFEEVLENADAELMKDIAIFAEEVMRDKESDVSHHALIGLSSSAYLSVVALTKNKPVTKAMDATLEKFFNDGLLMNIEEYNSIKQSLKALR